MSNTNLNSNIILTLYIRANNAKNGPPLGTTLGNIGVNTMKFSKEFNEFTKELPDYVLLKTTIIVTENKSFTFSVDLPSIGFIISILKKEENFKDINGVMHNIKYILLEDFVKLAKFKLPNHNLKKALKMIKGSLLSANIIIK